MAFTKGVFQHDVMTIWTPGFDSWEKIAVFLALGAWFPSKFHIVIPKTPLYKGMVAWILK